MCTRYVLLEEHYRAVLARLGIAAPPPFGSRYNIGPGTAIPVIRAKPAAAAPEVVAGHWGILRGGADGRPDKLVNVRAESLSRIPRFRAALRSRRAIVPASGFFEWQKHGSARLPFFFRRADGEPFGLAAIWEDAEQPGREHEPAAAVITTEPNAVVRAVHTRMPAILTLAESAAWLAIQPIELPALLQMLRPAAEEDLVATRVGARMNNVRYDAPDSIDAVSAESEDHPQLALGL